MVFKPEEILEKAKEIIEKHNCFFIDDVIAFLPCSKSTFYERFPLGSDGLDELKELLETNRVSVKVKMRKKWQDAEAPALQIALMKLICTDDEAHRLNGTKTVNENINKDVSVMNVDPLDESDNSTSENM